jgi:hypothetical protein
MAKKKDKFTDNLNKLADSLKVFTTSVVGYNKKLSTSINSFTSSTTKIKAINDKYDKLKTSLTSITDSYKKIAKSATNLAASLGVQQAAGKKPKNPVQPPPKPPMSPPGGGGGMGPGGGGGGGGSGGGGSGRGRNVSGDVPESGLGDLGVSFRWNIFSTAIDKLSSIFSEASEVQRRAFASNTTAMSTMTFDQVKSAYRLGVNVNQLTTEVLSLREEGITELSNSTIKLITRFKATDQRTQTLVKYLGENSVALFRSKEESQKLAVGIEQSARQYGARADDLIEMAQSLKQTLKLPSLLGFGGQTEGGAALLGAKTGARGQDAVTKFTDFLLNPENFQSVIALGLGDAIESLQSANTAEQSAKILQDAAARASAIIEARTSSVKGGGGAAAVMRAQTVLAPLGGQEALAAVELTKALGEANKLQAINNTNLLTMGTIIEKILTPLKLLGNAIEGLFNIIPQAITSPILTLVGSLTLLYAPYKILQTAISGLKSLQAKLMSLDATAKAILVKMSAPPTNLAAHRNISNVFGRQGPKINLPNVKLPSPVNTGLGWLDKIKGVAGLFGSKVAGYMGKALSVALRAIPIVGTIFTIGSVLYDLYDTFKSSDNKLEDIRKNTRKETTEKNLGDSTLYNMSLILSNIAQGRTSEIETSNLMRQQLDELRMFNRRLDHTLNAPDSSGGIGGNK